MIPAIEEFLNAISRSCELACHFDLHRFSLLWALRVNRKVNKKLEQTMARPLLSSVTSFEGKKGHFAPNTTLSRSLTKHRSLTLKDLKRYIQANEKSEMKRMYELRWREVRINAIVPAFSLSSIYTDPQTSFRRRR